MDHELDQTLTDLSDKASHIFLDFMTRIAKFEELANIGNRLLMGYHQELELFRRLPLQKTSKVVDDVIKANHTDRLKAYIESGCRHCHVDKQNISKLNSWHQGLQDHLRKAKSLLDELECLVKDVISIMQTVNESTSHLLDECFGDGIIHQATYFGEAKETTKPVDTQGRSLGEEMEQVHIRGERILLHAFMMTDVCSMLKLDYEMQERIILSLNLNSSSEELESYCLMWDLRPFVNDNVMHQCWRFVS